MKRIEIDADRLHQLESAERYAHEVIAAFAGDLDLTEILLRLNAATVGYSARLHLAKIALGA